MNRALRPLPWALVARLASQFLLGMVTNLYARLHQSVPGLHGNLDNRLGAAFLAYRQDNLYSLVMAAGFLAAFLAYWAALYLTR